MQENQNKKNFRFTNEYYKVLKAIVLSGGLILKNFRGKVENIPKESDLPIEEVDDSSTAHTILDDLIQEIALEILNIQFPKININVEEKTSRTAWFSSAIKDALCFHLDPLDGTLAYIKGQNDFSIGAAFSKNSNFISSAIYFPAYDRLFYAEKNKGIIVQNNNGEIISFQRKYPPLNTFCQKRCEKFIPILKSMKLEPLECLSAHHKVIAVAEGKISIHLSHLVKPHDTGIPQVFLEEMGGVCTDVDGNPIQYDPKFKRLPYWFAFYNNHVKEKFFEALKA